MNYRLRSILSMVAVSLMVALVVFTVVRQASAIDRLRGNYDALVEQYGELYIDAEAAGATPITVEPEAANKVKESAGNLFIPVPDPLPAPEKISPSRSTSQPGPPGARGPGPTETQVRAAVKEYCAETDNCDPTDVQIEQAVADYCANDACVGTEGARGEDGADGLDGLDGVAGQSATDAQIDAAVQRYCAAQPSGGCTGSDGADGEPGPAGPPGPRGEDGEDGKNGKNGKDYRPIDIGCSDGQVLTGFKIPSPDGDPMPYCEDISGS